MLVVVVVNSPMPTGTVTSYFISSTEREKSEAQFSVCFYSFCFALKRLFFSAITCENNIFVFIYKAFIEDIPPHRASERERERA